MTRLEFFTKWRAIASLDPPYGFPLFNNRSALPLPPFLLHGIDVQVIQSEEIGLFSCRISAGNLDGQLVFAGR